MRNQPEETTPKPAAASQEATESVDRVPDKFPGTTLEELREWAVARSMQADNDRMKKRRMSKLEDLGLRSAASHEATKSVDRVPDKFPGTTLPEFHEWAVARSMQADNDRMKKVHSKKPSDFGL